MTTEWVITTEHRQAQAGECYVYANEDQPPKVFPVVSGSTNPDDPGGPFRHAIVSVRRVVSGVSQ